MKCICDHRVDVIMITDTDTNEDTFSAGCINLMCRKESDECKTREEAIEDFKRKYLK